MSTRTSRTSLTNLASIGFLAAIVVACGGSDGDRASVTPSPLDSIVPSSPSQIPEFGAPVEPRESQRSEPATDPVAAVRHYLSAEVVGDAEQSYLALSMRSRESIGTAIDWTETAFERPRIVAFELDESIAPPPAGSTRATVLGTVTLEPRLDEVSGFVPERASIEWDVVAEDGGWLVDIVDTSVSPILPDEEGATAAAEVWASARQACRTEGEYYGSLLGSPVLGDRLCAVEGDVVAGPPMPLDDALTTQVVAAFGPDATTWARSVELSGAAELSVVTAPFGDHWVVVGVGG